MKFFGSKVSDDAKVLGALEGPRSIVHKCLRKKKKLSKNIDYRISQFKK